MEESREGRAHKLDELRILYKARECWLLQERYEWLAEREHLCTEHDERFSRYHDLSSSVHRLVLATSSGVDSSEEFMYKL